MCVNSIYAAPRPPYDPPLTRPLQVSPHFSTGGKWSPWGIVTIITTSFFVEYFIQPFQMLSWDWGMAAWRQHGFFGHIVAAVFYVACTLLPKPKVADADKKKKVQ